MPEEKQITVSFLLHPMSMEDVRKKFPRLKGAGRERLAAYVMRHLPDKRSNLSVTKENPSVIVSKTGKVIYAEFRATLLLPEFFTGEKPMDDEELAKRVIAACNAAYMKGARIIGLGTFNAIVGNSGIDVAKKTRISVTTGNSYTTTVAIEGTLLAAEKMGIDISKSTMAVVGATGSIGRSCAEILGPQFERVNLIGRDHSALADISTSVPNSFVFTDLREGLRDADVVVTVTSADTAIIEPAYIKPGAVVCDVARPRDVSAMVSEVRNDVLVIDGGIVQLPTGSKITAPIGLPVGQCEGCMAETFLLALEGKYETYTLGKSGPKSVTTAKVQEMSLLAEKHGFTLAGLRRNEAVISDEEIEQIRANAAKAMMKR